MQNQNYFQKKPAKRRYIIPAVILLLLITPLILFIFLIQKRTSDPASEASIRRLAAAQLNKEQNVLTDEDFTKITLFSLEISECSDISLLEKFTNLQQLQLNILGYPESVIPKWKIILAKYGIYDLKERFVIDLSPLKKLTNLQRLQIAGMPIKNMNRYFTGLINLKQLVLIGTPISNKNRIGDGPSMDHTINIPEEYRSDQNILARSEYIVRYINAYDQNWWYCIKNYANDINYQSTAGDSAFNGWPAALAGGEDGYKAAEERVRKNIQQYGKKKTQIYLQKLLYEY